MLKYLLERKIAFLVVVFLAVLASSLNVGVAFLIKKIIDSITKMDIAGMLYLALGTLVYIVFVVLSDFLAHYSRDQFCKNVSCKLKDDLTASILNMSVVDKEEKSYADYQSLIISDVSTLEVNYFNALLAITYQLLNLLFSLAGIIYIQPRFLPVICLICVIPIIFPYFTKNKLEGLQANKSSTRSAYIDKLSDVLNGFRSIKFYNAEHKYKKYSADANKTYTNADISLSKHENLIMSSAYGVGLLIILLTWVSGAFFIKFVTVYNATYGGFADTYAVPMKEWIVMTTGAMATFAPIGTTVNIISFALSRKKLDLLITYTNGKNVILK